MIRVGDRIRMTKNYWYRNKGMEGTVSRFSVSPLDDTLMPWIWLDGDERDYPMAMDVYEVTRRTVSHDDE